MDEYVSTELLRWYQRIEDQLLQFSEQVPFTIGNHALTVPVLASWIVDACGLIDSVFRDMTPGTVEINGGQKVKDDCNFQDFAWLYKDRVICPHKLGQIGAERRSLG